MIGFLVILGYFFFFCALLVFLAMFGDYFV